MHRAHRLALGSSSRVFGPTPKPRRADGLFCSRPFHWFEVSRGKVYFQPLVNWGTFSDEEFRNRAVHVREHPRHHQFLDVLGDGCCLTRS